MSPIPMHHIHEEDFVWRPAILDDEDTVAEATAKLAETFIGRRVRPRPDRELRMVHVEKGSQVLEPQAKVRDVIEPLSLVKLIWWPR